MLRHSGCCLTGRMASRPLDFLSPRDTGPIDLATLSCLGIDAFLSRQEKTGCQDSTGQNPEAASVLA